VDAEVIQALYEASGAGVEIDLLVRGICCLRPGVPGVSDRIRVRSVIGRFLEHSRAVCFENGGRREVFIGSADWMPRNFDRRIEVIVPVEDSVHQESVRHTMAVMLEDNRQAWDLRAEGSYSQCQPGDEPERGTHRVLMDYYRERGVKAEVTGTFPVVRLEV
jgi:polyphosphate kinase